MSEVVRVSRLTLLSQIAERKNWRVGMKPRDGGCWTLELRDLSNDRELLASIVVSPEESIEDGAERLIGLLGAMRGIR